MKNISRRSLFGFGAIGLASVALSGCVTTRNGSTTTTTLSVAKVEAYIAAGLTAADTVASVFSAIPSLSKYSSDLHNAVSFLTTASAAFSSAVGNKVTIDYNDANWKTIIDSILGAIKNIVSVIYSIIIDLKTENLSAEQKQILEKVELAYNAISTVLAVFQAVLTPATADLSKMKMSEGQALAVLNVSTSSPSFLSAVAQ